LPAAPPAAGDVDEATQQVWTHLSEAAQFAQVTVGNGQKLELIDLRVTVQVEGLRVRTLVDHIDKDPVAQVAQGKFRYSLPPDASVSYCAMFTGQPNVTPQFFGPKSNLTGQDDETLAALPPEEVALNPDPSQRGALTEGRIAVGVKATIAYETEINKKIDPALSEYVGPNTFEAKVYPIQPNGYNRVLIAYEQTLPRFGEALRYTFPLPKGDAKIGLAKSLSGTCEFVVVAKKTAVQKAAYKGQIEGVDGKDGKAAFVAKYVFKGTTPGGMLAWDFTPAQGSPDADVVSGTDPMQKKDYTLVRIQPVLAELAAKKAYAKRAVFLLDTSRSENQRFGTSMKLLDAILAESPGIAQFAVVTFDAGARWLKPAWTANDANGRQSVQAALNGGILEGATDFSAALRALAKPPFQPDADKQLDVFVLSDGDLNWGDVTLSSLLGLAPFRLGQLPRLRLLELVRLALDVDDVGVVRQPVDQGDDASGVGEHVGPLAKRAVGADQRRTFLVAQRDDLEEQVGVGVVVAEVAQFVDHEQVGTRGLTELAGAAGGSVGNGQVAEQGRRGGEAHGVAGDECAVGDVLGDHGLADAVRADQHGVGGVVQKVERHEVLDSRAVNPLRPRPVEVRERLEAADVRVAQAAVEAPAGPLVFFPGHEAFELCRSGTSPQCAHRP
jgi:hypothetical protein